MSEYRQLSLFDMIGDRSKAVCMMTGAEVEANEPEDWMKSLVPAGELVVMVGAHPMVLSPTPLTERQVRPELAYMHYRVAGVIYAGCFVGREVA